MDYKEAAEIAKGENPDGWYADPEAMLALSEWAWEEGNFKAPVFEVFRTAWRKANEKWQATGQNHYAAEMVAIENEVEHIKKAHREKHPVGVAAGDTTQSKFD